MGAKPRPVVPSRPLLSDEEERAERDDRLKLRSIDAKLDALYRRRGDLMAQARAISSEQRTLFDRRQDPQAEVEQLYDEHGRLGGRLAELRKQRDAARRALETAVIHRRELTLQLGPGDRIRPEAIRKEIADLELRQQTTALPIDEENALIARLRQRARDLKDAEARTSVVAEHEQRRKTADQAILAARAEVERLSKELESTKGERDRTMGAVREKLAAAGGILADLRAKGRARAELMEQVYAVSREMDGLEREGRELLQRSRSRRDEARRTLREYSRGRGDPSESLLASAAEAHLEELLKRGRVTLSG